MANGTVVKTTANSYGALMNNFISCNSSEVRLFWNLGEVKDVENGTGYSVNVS